MGKLKSQKSEASGGVFEMVDNEKPTSAGAGMLFEDTGFNQKQKMLVNETEAVTHTLQYTSSFISHFNYLRFG
jgi:hypothetical protein